MVYGAILAYCSCSRFLGFNGYIGVNRDSYVGLQGPCMVHIGCIHDLYNVYYGALELTQGIVHCRGLVFYIAKLHIDNIMCLGMIGLSGFEVWGSGIRV